MAEHQPKVEPREHPYRLRESSKVPSRYRDYVEEGFLQQQHGGAASSTGSPYSPGTITIPIRRQRGSTPRKANQQLQGPSTHGQRQYLPPAPQLRQEQVVEEEAAEDDPGPQMQHIFDVVIGAEQEVSTSGYEDVADIKPPPRALYRYPPPPHHMAGRYTTGADLSDELKCNLRKLKNVLKLPKARRFVFCEFFYSGVDQQIFLAENEFSQLMRESFPNLKCIKLKKPEWREVRRLIGKPRRCSQAFLDEEREALEAKRQKIRAIYNGSCTSLDNEVIDLPSFLPRPPIVGQKIYARVRSPKDGIYAATVDSISPIDGYRVVFDKDDQLPASYIKDYEVMFDQPTELLSLSYFLEQNRANVRGAKVAATPVSHFYPTPNGYVPVVDPSGKVMSPMVGIGRGGGDQSAAATGGRSPRKVAIQKDEKVGNFPVRMLVILVKLCKVVEYKKTLIGHLTMMNDYAERINLLANEYPDEFKIQFSQLVIDLENVNKLFLNYLAALQTHYNTLLPHLNEPQPTDRPEVLRKTCNTHAYQIVKHCLTTSPLRQPGNKILHLITQLASLMLQLRSIGAQKKKFTAFDMSLLGESLKQIRAEITPQNAAAFQDYVEIHMRQILTNKQ